MKFAAVLIISFSFCSAAPISGNHVQKSSIAYSPETHNNINQLAPQSVFSVPDSKVSKIHKNHQAQLKDQELIAAVKSGNIAAVLQLIRDGADVNAVDENKVCALILAIKKGSADIANALVEAGANVNVTDQAMFANSCY